MPKTTYPKSLAGFRQWTRESAATIPVGKLLGMKVLFVNDSTGRPMSGTIRSVSEKSIAVASRDGIVRRVKWDTIYTRPLSKDGTEMKNIALFTSGSNLLSCRYCDHRTPLADIEEGAETFTCFGCGSAVRVPTPSMPWNKHEISGKP